MDEDTRYLWPSWVRTKPIPVDLTVLLIVVTLAVLVAFVPALRETPLRLIVGLPFLLFVPGYALVTALLPGDRRLAATDRENTSPTTDRPPSQGISPIVRITLSFGSSIAIVSLLGLVLDATGLGIRLAPIVVALSVLVVLLVIMAAYRRWEIPEHERSGGRYRSWLAATRREVFQPETRLDALLTVLLVLCLLFAVSGIGYAITIPSSEERVTELYLLTENDEGKLVSEGYDTQLESGQSLPVVLGVTNHEGAPLQYSVVVQLHRIQFEQDGGKTNATVSRRDTIDRFSIDVAPGESVRTALDIEPGMTGEDLRLTFLLYRGEPPAEPTLSNAYREVHLWIDATETPGSSDA